MTMPNRMGLILRCMVIFLKNQAVSKV
uniref:Protein SPIRRIG n=1 Tax=Rhizophora mucronata TaxID=61149 RepID=A0A2P2P4Q7_RHIMU